jgi:hypothetical protein
MSDATPIEGTRDRRWLILGVIGLAQLMVILDLTVMNIALPSAGPCSAAGRSAQPARRPPHVAG